MALLKSRACMLWNVVQEATLSVSAASLRLFSTLSGRHGFFKASWSKCQGQAKLNGAREQGKNGNDDHVLSHWTLTSTPSKSVCKLSPGGAEVSSVIDHVDRRFCYARTPLMYGKDKNVPMTGICRRKLTTTGKKSLYKVGADVRSA